MDKERLGEQEKRQGRSGAVLKGGEQAATKQAWCHMNVQKSVADFSLQLLLLKADVLCGGVCYKYPGNTAADLE